MVSHWPLAYCSGRIKDIFDILKPSGQADCISGIQVRVSFANCDHLYIPKLFHPNSLEDEEARWLIANAVSTIPS